MKPNGTILTLAEVAERVRFSQSWVYKKCEAGIMPHIRIGKSLRFREEDVDAWLKKHSCKGTEKV